MRKPFDGDYELNQDNLFGANPQLYTKYSVKQPDGTMGPLKGHNGIDYKTPSGTVIKAPHAGKVIEASFDPQGFGNYVKIESDKEGSILAHLEKITVSVGFEVKEGDVIGTSDNTGYSTGPHLHWGYYRMPRDRANGFSGYIDPLPFLVEAQNHQEPTAVQLYTKEQYDAAMSDRNKFWKERDDALAQVKLLEEKVKESENKLTAFNAMGYMTVEDVQKAVEGKQNELTGLQTQLVQVLARNANLADQLKKKDEEDYTAINSGLAAMTELKVLKEDYAKVKAMLEVKGKPTTWNILQTIQNLKDLAQRPVFAKENVTVKEGEVPVPTKGGFGELLKHLGLSFMIFISIGSVVFANYSGYLNLFKIH